MYILLTFFRTHWIDYYRFSVFALHRFRLLLARNNISINSPKTDMITSHEYILDYRILPNQELDESSIHTKYTIVDTVNMDKYEEYWAIAVGGLKNKVEVFPECAKKYLLKNRIIIYLKLNNTKPI